MEFWKEIKGYNGKYLISSQGRVKSTTSGTDKILSQNKNAKGYYKVNLSNGRKSHKQFPIHRLLAEYFIPNPNKELYINHINGERHYNSLDNLEWVNIRENTTHGIKLNRKHSYKTGVYCYNKKGKYISIITINGITNKLGIFDSEEDAHLAYKNALISNGLTNKYAQ